MSFPFPCLSIALGLSLASVVVLEGAGLWGTDGPCLGAGGLEPLPEGRGDVGGAEALDRVPQEGFPCHLRHGGFRGSLVGVGGGAGAHLLEGVHYVHPFSPFRSPGPLHPAAELPQGGGRPPGKVGGGLVGGGLRARGSGAAVAGARGGGCVRAARGTGSSVLFVGGHGHGTAVAGVAAPRGAAAALVGTGGGGCVRAARGRGNSVLFVGGGGHGHERAVVGGGGAGGSGSGSCGGSGGRMLMGGAGNGKRGDVRGGGGADMGGGSARGGTRGSRSSRSGALKGCGTASVSASGASEQLRRGGAERSVRAGGGCGAWWGSRSAAVCGIRPGSRGASRGAAWYFRGGREVPPPSWICRVALRRRWRLVVRVKWLSRLGVGLEGPFGVDVVAGGNGSWKGGGAALVVGGVLGWTARWVVLPSHALVLLVHGGLRPGGVGWCAVVVVVVVVMLVVVWALVAVALVVVVMVLRVCPEDPLAFRWGFGIGHRLQPLGPYGLVGIGGGSGAGLNGDRGRGVSRPRDGLAGGGGDLWEVDDGALGDEDVDEGLGGVVFGGRFWGGGSRLGGGGSLGNAEWGVLAWVWVSVWVRAGSLLLLLYLLSFLGLCGVVLVMLLLVVLVVVLLLLVLSFRFRCWFGVGLWVGVRFEVEEDLVPEARSKKKCFSNALGYTLVVLEMLQAHRHFYLSIGPTKSGDNTF